MTDHDKRDALRPHAEQLARLLASERGACILGSLQQLQLLWKAVDKGDAAPASDAAPAGADAASALRIGIWTGDRAGGAFRRVPYVEAWNRYADVDVIPPKGGSRRVLLLGESSARAYMYDPVVTLAQLLESCLKQYHEPVEVVDLAMVGQDMGGLERVLESCDALRPDAIVVFAGNNWIFEPVPPMDEPALENALARGDLAEAKRLHVEEILVRRVHAFLDVMHAAVRRNGAYGLFVVPEFNLAHHVDQTVDFVPALPLERMRAWIGHRSRAEEARRAGRPEECSRTARAMIELDRGLHPAPHRLLAECAERRGDRQAAYEHYCRARDVSSGLLAYCTPRCPTSVQEAIVAGCRSRQIGVVDLRDVFARQPGLPGRDLFLDYCHLTLRGLRLAASEMAAHLLPVVGGPAVAADRIDTRGPAIDPRDEATAHLLAAIHNGHVGASLEAVTYGCEAAFRTCPEVESLALGFLDFRSRRSQDWMPRSYDAAVQSRSARRCLTTQPLPAYLAIGDVPLYQAIEDVLEARGVRARERFERLRVEEALAEGDDLDLLRSRRITMTLLESRRYGYYRSRHPVSSFFLLTPAASRAVVRATWRTRNADATPVVVRLNDRVVFETRVESRWSAAMFDLPGESLRQGTNCLQIEWSIGAPRAAAGRGFYNPLRPPPEAYHVFGEIQDLTVSR